MSEIDTDRLIQTIQLLHHLVSSSEIIYWKHIQFNMVNWSFHLEKEFSLHLLAATILYCGRINMILILRTTRWRKFWSHTQDLYHFSVCSDYSQPQLQFVSNKNDVYILKEMSVMLWITSPKDRHNNSHIPRKRIFLAQTWLSVDT